LRTGILELSLMGYVSVRRVVLWGGCVSDV